ncbi:MAG: hypothetical protein A2521_11080 [Deltaproteobacteria bacterium RIFOXYD12_FULL_57_12]|nr:MAG: hypothetical protein A2521_11080 [Deltaproteobacteria bacterium RIFOXYD12_FULL_57_12]
MKMNRIQFQQGLRLNQFFAQYGKEQQCKSVLESARWPHGFICPKFKGQTSMDSTNVINPVAISLQIDPQAFAKKIPAGQSTVSPLLCRSIEILTMTFFCQLFPSTSSGFIG